MNELKYKLRVPSPNQGSVSLLVNAKILKILTNTACIEEHILICGGTTPSARDPQLNTMEKGSQAPRHIA